MAKKEKMPSEQSREKLRDLRIKAMAREQEELDTKQTQFTSQQVIIKYDVQDLDVVRENNVFDCERLFITCFCFQPRRLNYQNILWGRPHITKSRRGVSK